MSDISYSSSVLPAVPGKANYPTSGKTSDYVLTQADVSGFKTFTNEGAAADTYTKLLLHMDDAGLTDATGKTVTLNGSVVRSTAQSKFGGYSSSFDGSSGYLAVPDSDDFYFGTSDFTIDFWVYPTSLSSLRNWVFIGNAGSDNCLIIRTNGTKLNVLGTNTTANWDFSATSIGDISSNTWQHVALVRSGTSIRVYVNGVRFTMDVESYSGSFRNSSIGLTIGAHNTGSGYSFYYAGYMDELRILKGFAAWTSDFTLPTSAHVLNTTGQVTFTLPSAAPGMSVCFLNKAGKDMLINAASGDNFSIVGSETPTLTSIKSSVAGEKINFTALDSTTWYSTKNTSGWGNGVWYLGVNATSGFTSGGYGGVTFYATINKFSLTSGSAATTWGNRTVNRTYAAGMSSSTRGITAGGHADPTNVIDSFPFASSSGATSWGVLLSVRLVAVGQSSQTTGFSSGGQNGPSATEAIEAVSFASASNSTSWGSLTIARGGPPSGCNSPTHGFTCGGYAGAYQTRIDRFNMASSGNATTWADQRTADCGEAGCSSDSYGFLSGGDNNVTSVDRFPFASQTNSTAWSTLSAGYAIAAGVSGPTSGFTCGGTTPTTNTITTFSFVSNSNGSSWSTLTFATYGQPGHQG